MENIKIVVEADTNDYKQKLKEAWKIARDTWKTLDQSLRKRLELNIDNFEQKIKSSRTLLKTLDQDTAEAQKLRLDINSYKRNLTEAKRSLNNYLNTGDKATSRLQIKFNQVTNEIKETRAELIRLWKSTKGLDRIEKEINDTTTAFKKGKISLSKYTSEIKRLQRESQWLWKNFSWVSSALKGLATWFLAYKSVTLFKDALRWAAETAISFESAFIGVRKTLEWTEKQFKTLEKGFIDLSKKIPITVEELAWIGEVWWQLWVAVEDILEFTETVAKIWVTTNLTAEEAGTAFARIANVLQEPISNIDRMASSVVWLWNNFATSEKEILNFASEMVAAWWIVWLTSDEIFWISTAFTSVWINAEAWWSAVSKALIKMNNAIIEWWDELDWFAKASWLTTAEFKRGWEDDAWQTFGKFITGLWKAWDEWVNTLQDLLWTDIRTTKAFLAVAWAGDLVTESISRSNEEFEKNNALTEEAEKRFESVASVLQLQENRWKAWGVGFWNTINKAKIVFNDLFLFLIPNGFAIVSFWITLLDKKIQNWLSNISIAVVTVAWTISTIFAWLVDVFKGLWKNAWILWHNIWQSFNDIPWTIKTALNFWMEKIANFLNWWIDLVNSFANRLWLSTKFDQIKLPTFDTSDMKASFKSFEDINLNYAKSTANITKWLIDKFSWMKKANEQFLQDEALRIDYERKLADKWNKDSIDSINNQWESEIKAEKEKWQKILDLLEEIENEKNKVWGWSSKRIEEKKDEIKKFEELEKDRIKNELKLEKEKNEELIDNLDHLEDKYEKLAEVFDENIERSKDKVKELWEEISKLADDFDEKIKESSEKVRWWKKGLWLEKEELWLELAKRKLEIEEKLRELEQETPGIKKVARRTSEKTLQTIWKWKLWWWVTWTEALEFKKLTEELSLIKQNADLISKQNLIESEESETAKLLRISDLKQKELEKDIQDEQNKLFNLYENKEKEIAILEEKKQEEENILIAFEEKKELLDEKYKTTILNIEQQITDDIKLQAIVRIAELEKIRQKAIATAIALARAGKTYSLAWVAESIKRETTQALETTKTTTIVNNNTITTEVDLESVARKLNTDINS